MVDTRQCTSRYSLVAFESEQWRHNADEARAQCTVRNGRSFGNETRKYRPNDYRLRIARRVKRTFCTTGTTSRRVGSEKFGFSRFVFFSGHSRSVLVFRFVQTPGATGVTFIAKMRPSRFVCLFLFFSTRCRPILAREQ